MTPTPTRISVTERVARISDNLESLNRRLRPALRYPDRQLTNNESSCAFWLLEALREDCKALDAQLRRQSRRQRLAADKRVGSLEAAATAK